MTADQEKLTRRELLRALKPPARWTLARVGFAIGWLGIFASGAWLAMDPRGDEFYAALFALLISIAVVTLPFALRELERGKPA